MNQLQTQVKMENLKIYVNEFKDLCLFSDNLAKISSKQWDKLQVNGWTLFSTEYRWSTEFKAVAYRKEDKITICFVGTNFKSIQDIMTDIKMIFFPTKQMKQAFEFYAQIKQKYAGYEIILAGHSEGGSECQYVSVMGKGVPAFTFNAFMTGQLYAEEEKFRAEDFIYNFRNVNDLVSMVGEDIGHQFITIEKYKPNFWNLLTKPRYNHRLENIGDCLKAVRLDVFNRNKKYCIQSMFKS